MSKTFKVWDLPTRIFHWALVISILGLFLTGDSERLRDIHEYLGYGVAGLLAFRLFWGVFGGVYARFTQFVRGPVETSQYLRSILAGKPRHYLGHNPLGAIAIVLLLTFLLGSSVSGWMLMDDNVLEEMEEVHEFFTDGLLVLIFLHLAGVAVGSWLHRENLVLAMWTGKKRLKSTAQEHSGDSATQPARYSRIPATQDKARP
jgi:cytochrome b